jgi:hypothetical protein
MLPCCCRLAFFPACLGLHENMCDTFLSSPYMRISLKTTATCPACWPTYTLNPLFGRRNKKKKTSVEIRHQRGGEEEPSFVVRPPAGVPVFSLSILILRVVRRPYVRPAQWRPVPVPDLCWGWWCSRSSLQALTSFIS